jgi:hypothetical protein
MSRGLFWTVIAVTLAVYGAMAAWSIPRIAAEAGGIEPFDLRLFGYTEADARAFLGSLSDAGRAFYARVQHGIDILFPGLLALSLILCFDRLVPAQGPRLALSLLALATMAADYRENALVARMLAMAPEAVPAEFIARASLATQVKSGVVTLALTALILALFLRWRRGRI